MSSALVWGLQRLPLLWLARAGRVAGLIGWWLAARRRRVAQENLQLCFGKEQSPADIRALARESFRRFGETVLCAVGTAGMATEQLSGCAEFVGLEKLTGRVGVTPVSCVLAIGHFGNFELFGYIQRFFPDRLVIASYRSLKPLFLDHVVLQLRRSTGCQFFERRSNAALLQAALRGGPTILGLLADQSGGMKGLRLPFLGHDCSTTRAPASLAVRCRMRLHPAFCYRTGLGRWRLEIGDEIPTNHNGRRRSSREIMLDVNRAFETAVRRDPANWYWMHRRWK